MNAQVIKATEEPTEPPVVTQQVAPDRCQGKISTAFFMGAVLSVSCLIGGFYLRGSVQCDRVQVILPPAPPEWIPPHAPAPEWVPVPIDPVKPPGWKPNGGRGLGETKI